MDLLNEDTPISVTEGNKNIKRKNNGWDINNIKQDQRYIVKYMTNGVENSITFRIGIGNRVILTEQSKVKLNDNFTLKIYPSSNIPSVYQPLLREIQRDGQTILIPVETNFSFTNGLQMDNDAIQRLKKDEKLFMEVDFEYAFNRDLIDAYRSNNSKENLRNLQKQVTVYLKTRNNKFVGVLKGIDSNLIVENDKFFDKLTDIRDTITQRIIDEYDESTQVLDMGINLPVSQVHIGHPNLNIVNNDGKYVVENIPFNNQSTQKVKDVGYVLNGKVYLKNKVSDYERYPFLTNIIRDGDAKYFNKKIPLVIFDFNGRNIAYPVVLNNNTIDLSGEFSTIIQSNLRDNDKIIEINKLLTRANIDVKKQGLTFDNYNETKLQELQSTLSNVNEVGDITRWLDSSVNMEDILMNDVSINIDILDKPFHSPKIKTSILQTNGLDSQSLIEFDNSVNMSEDLENESDDLLNEEC